MYRLGLVSLFLVAPLRTIVLLVSVFVAVSYDVVAYYVTGLTMSKHPQPRFSEIGSDQVGDKGRSRENNHKLFVMCLWFSNAGVRIISEQYYQAHQLKKNNLGT